MGSLLVAMSLFLLSGHFGVLPVSTIFTFDFHFHVLLVEYKKERKKS